MRSTRALLGLAAVMTLAGCGTATNTTTVTTTGTPVTTTSTTVANLQPYADSTGNIATFTRAGSIDLTGPFFLALGTNGRTCATCHQLSQGMSLNTASVKALFTSSLGADPLFAAVDGANCPTAATGDAAAHSLILNNGLVRVTVPLPASAQFKLSVVSDPYGCAVTTDSAGRQVVSVYRRPLPATSLSYLSNIMWDGRDTTTTLGSAASLSANLVTDLTQQVVEALTNHSQATATSAAGILSAIVTFEQGLFTAQESDAVAGSLSASGATGGATNLSTLRFYPGINDSLGQDPTGAGNTQNAMTLYAAWANSTNARQASIARGEALFNTSNLNITNVAGVANVQRVSCSFCHDTPNVGNRSLALLMDLGTAHSTAAETDGNIVAALQAVSVPTLPVYRITGCTSATSGLPVTYTTSDPGAGLVTGLCADVNKLKVPILRGLAARAPYFHNGSASSLAQVVSFYDSRFDMNLSQNEQTDLVNFLSAL